MANDRLWLMCNCCGASTLLFKYYPGRMGYMKHTQEELGQWMIDHIDLCSDADTDFHGKPPFTLEVESQAAHKETAHG